jgi:hypothetical protein
MSNLIDLYKEITYPASKVTVGMKLIVQDSELEGIENGTICKVTKICETCKDDYCKDWPSSQHCCRQEFNVELPDGENVGAIACYTTLYTEDGKRVVADKKYCPRKKEKRR